MKNVKLHLTEGTEFLTLRLGVMTQIDILEESVKGVSEIIAAENGKYNLSVRRQQQSLREAKALLEKLDCLEVGDHLEVVE